MLLGLLSFSRRQAGLSSVPRLAVLFYLHAHAHTQEKVAEAAHVIHRKASNTVKDIQSGDAKHIIERKARNTVEDIKEFAGGVGEKLAPAAAKVSWACGLILSP